jgi:Domain of unknown function (DUF4398)
VRDVTARGRHAARRALWLALALLVAVPACGSINYINQVTRKASADVEAARAAHARTLAPYWYTLAVEYLNKAREEAAEADFQAANLLGQKASQAARKAVEVALSNDERSARPRQRAPAASEDAP